MCACAVPIQRIDTMSMDDELTAITLQLEELGLISASGKGKHAVGHPPDYEVAYNYFQEEIERYKAVLRDRRFAQSMGSAVHTDQAVIDDVAAQETQCYADHRFAVQLSTDDPEFETPSRSISAQPLRVIEDWMSTVSGAMAQHSILEVSDGETEAGPSLTYVERQAETIKKLTTEYNCIACTERFPRSNMVITLCGHRYCAECMRSLFMRSTKDESLYPPKCCKQRIPLALVERHMDADDLEAFQTTAIEFTTPHRVYCSNIHCAKFILPNDIDSALQRADCPTCGTATCTACLNKYHDGSNCPDNPSLRQTQELAASLGWQACKFCKRVVQLRSGCNHITCICDAEFCYVCGVEWKNCSCPPADIERIEERAEEIVARDAPADIAPHQRRARFDQIFAELQDNHECEHSRRFQRVTWGAPRRGFQCEMCDARHHRYILQCRRCYINVCEECRRNRI